MLPRGRHGAPRGEVASGGEPSGGGGPHSAIASVAIAPGPEPLEALASLRGLAEPWLLESALRGEPLGRYSFAGAEPWAVLRAWGDEVEIEVRRPLWPELASGRHRLRADPLAALRALLPPAPAGDVPGLPFVGGAVGYLGYELAARFEPVRLSAADDLRLPDGGP